MKNEVIKSIVLVLILWFLYTIIPTRKNIIPIANTCYLEDYDLILIKGNSVQSKLISVLKFKISDYSHIGIVVKKKGKILILHSTPDGTETNGIRLDDLQSFLNLSYAIKYIILRYKGLSDIMRQNLELEFNKYQNSQVPFDYDFNNYDHNKIYCTELVNLIFCKSGVYESHIFNLSNPIYPRYFLDLKEFILIYSSEKRR